MNVLTMIINKLPAYSEGAVRRIQMLGTIYRCNKPNKDRFAHVCSILLTGVDVVGTDRAIQYEYG